MELPLSYLCLTAFYLNSEHILSEINTQLWEAGRIKIIIPISQEAEVQRASVFFPLAGQASAGHGGRV